MSIMNPLQHLILLLEEVKNSSNILIHQGKKQENIYLDPNHPAVYHASEYASTLLFSKRGRLEFEQKAELQRQGYYVIQLEGSSNGWLIAGIQIPRKGVVVFYNHVLLDEMEKQNEKFEGEN